MEDIGIYNNNTYKVLKYKLAKKLYLRASSKT